MLSDLVITDTVSASSVQLYQQQAQGNPYFAYLATQGSSLSVMNIRSRLNGYAQFRGAPNAASFDWSQLTYVSVLAYRTYLLNRSKKEPDKKDLSATSVNTIVVSLRGIANTARQMRILSREEWEAIQSIKQLRSYRTPTGRSMTSKESQYLLNSADFTEKKGARDKAVLALLLGCGLRRDEVAKIELKNVDIQQNSIVLIGKGNKERKVFLTDETKRLVLNWLQFRGTEKGYLFGRLTRGKRTLDVTRPLHPTSIYRIVEDCWSKAADNIAEGKFQTASPETRELLNREDFRPAKISTHDLRRTFATRMLAKGTDIVLVQHLMGHASVTTTAKYDRRGENEMKQAMQGYEL